MADEDMRRLVYKQLIVGAVLVASVVLAAWLERQATSPDPFLPLRKLAPVRRAPWTEEDISRAASFGTEYAQHWLDREWRRTCP